ncbi:MAG: hypothetical protein MI974_29180 [Chitinophagales bacterium]|nr:hypothetical protein [Chitinophagales bacterium]
MMEWYIPITILPAVGMLILSTTGQMMALSNEIAGLLGVKCTPFQHEVSDLKIVQLNRLTRAAALLYVSAACFVLSGILGAILPENITIMLPNYVLVFGVILVLIALVLLMNYGFHAISIRKMQHKHNHEMREG